MKHAQYLAGILALTLLAITSHAWSGVTVAMTAPASGSTPTAPVTLSASASATGGYTVSKVEFFHGSTLIGTDTSSPYSISWSNAQPGTYALTAKATATKQGQPNQTATSSPVNITVNARPLVMFSNPANNTTFGLPANVMITATATDSDGTIAKVEFSWHDTGGLDYGQFTDTAPPYSFVLTPIAFPTTYEVVASAYDNQGGVAAAVLYFSTNAPPIVSLTSPSPNTIFSAPASIPISADAFDIVDGTVAQVQFFANGSLIGTDTTAPYSIEWNNVAAGSYSVTAVATDNLGATTTSAALNISVTATVAQLYFIHVDHLNTPRLVADSAGTTVWRWDQQEPFADNIADENPSGLGAFDLPLRLPGQRYDVETGLHYNYYRNYDPSLGRYEESDPIGLAWSLNTYAYVNGNPTRYADPLGLFGMYGNWGGRNWSGAVSSPTIPVRDTKPTTPGGPVDLLDQCFMDHDRCYGSIETGCLSAQDARNAYRDCDRYLAKCIDGLPKDPSLWCAYNPLYCNAARRSARWWFSPD